jgi:tetratricopeptide (TPR) repeat protein
MMGGGTRPTVAWSADDEIRRPLRAPAGQRRPMTAAAPRLLYDEVLKRLAAHDLRGAALACRQLNATTPGFAPGWAIASHIALLLRNAARAVEFAERAIALEPANARFMTTYAQALRAAGRMDEAVARADAAVGMAAGEAAAHAELGGFYAGARLFERAVARYARAVELAPGVADHRFNLAATLRITGDLARAEDEYDRVLTLKPDEHEGYFNRADLRRQTPDRNHVAELEMLLGRGISEPRGEVFVRYALAKELEDLGRYPESFAALVAGSALRRRHLEYDLGRDLETVRWIEEAYPSVRLAVGGGCADEAPVFIVGMPRSGTTLLERVLDGHSCVTSAGELTDFADALVGATTAKAGKPLDRRELVAASAGIDFAALGADYLRRTQPYRLRGLRFIDKLPLNYLYCGLIHLALPNARIIHLTRHPLAACHAMFKTLFKDGYPFSYDLNELAAYYAGYRRLMRHWHAAMPQAILDVSYEALVADLEGETRRVLAYLGLALEPGCLEFHRNPNPSATASAAQVRRPLYASSVGLWRNYERELAPLRAALIAAGIGGAELDA